MRPDPPDERWTRRRSSLFVLVTCGLFWGLVWGLVISWPSAAT